jgi:GT2 family glycosyltransferase/tetratricopeptide (TPR) repeat protein
MGEIFTVAKPAVPMRFTGERMTSAIHGQIEYEHLHRYCFARLFCRGKDVVDAAAGEGYGSALLARVASSVVGVEIAAEAVEHAVAAYRQPNLRFVRGDVARLPLRSASADVVVSFETIEHLYEQAQFLAEIRRVLRPDGVLVISSPDSEVYSYPGSEVNPFHVYELTAEEFIRALRAQFPNVQCYAQRALIGSAITIDAPSCGVLTFERRDETHVDARRGLSRSPYLVAVASARPLDEPCQSLYIDQTRSPGLLTSRLDGHRDGEARGPAPAVADGGAGGNHAHEGAAPEETEKLRQRVAALARQRDAAQLAAAEAVRGELARMREERAATERQLRERIEWLEHGERETLTRLVNDFSGRMHSAGETEAALRARLKELGGELAEARLRRRQAPGLSRLIAAPVRRRLALTAQRAASRAADAHRWRAAARHWRRAVRWSPARPAIWKELGRALEMLGDHHGAEGTYLQAAALDPQAADPHVRLGRLFQSQQRWEDAAAAYTRALQLQPEEPEALREFDELAAHLVTAGDSARDRRDWATAARCYRRGLARQPGLTPIWVQLGHALKEQGEYVEAEAAYRRALALDDKAADSHLQLGHLLKLTARRNEAIKAYAAALQRDPDLLPAREALNAALGYPAAEADLDALLDPADSRRLLRLSAGEAAFGLPASQADRYGALCADAARRLGAGRDVIWLGVIDWNFRIQRPQHLAARLADRGARVFYLSLLFEQADERGRFHIIDSPHEGVFEVRMRLCGDPGESIYHGLSAAAVRELQLALDELIAVTGMSAPVVMVEHPAWHDVACGVPGATVVYDCLDLATGFSNTADGLPAAEAALLGDADLVIAASRPLAEHVAARRPAILVRNAADVDFFAAAASDGAAGSRPVIGYFGAIAEWFAIDWIERCAAARPDWEFRLIGRTDSCDISRAAALANVSFLGEKPYRELPALLSEFDVAVIPFRMIELTRCTNPVKLYEYMAAGKAVVAAPMPEIVEAGDLVYIAADAAEFESRIAQALAQDGPALRQRRREWAHAHTWASRARQLEEAIAAADPLVSVIVLTHNHWDYTRECLASVRRWSDYPNLEIIVVDNGSTDETPERLRELAERDARVRVILNTDNRGFPAGNNVGLRAARGEFLILLNNDTVVTRGWVRDLIRPMQQDERVGLAGPLTNKIGNEQKVLAGYRTLADMPDWARRFARERLRRTVETNNLAFFCVAIRRRVVDEVGLLDEAYGIGFFEDDDYCRRVRQANWKLAIADDVFVHHHLSISFDALGDKAAELMARNRALFEERWGPWQPHRYREEPGFG